MSPFPPQSGQGGMLLIDVLLAILIFSMGMLGLIGLQASSLSRVSDAKCRADASFLANQSIGTMWGDPAGLAAHAVADEAVSSLPDGKRTIEVKGDRVTVTLSWKLPGQASRHSYQAVAHINANP